MLTRSEISPNRRFAVGFVLYLLVLIPPAYAQGIAFSIDVQSPTAGLFGSAAGLPDAFYGREIDGGDILTVGTPVPSLPPVPNNAVRGPVLVTPGTLVFGADTGVPNSRTLDLNPTAIGALLDREVEVDALSFGRDDGRAVFFSVDRLAIGSQGGVAEQALTEQAPGDIFRNMLELEGNALIIDGRGGEAPNRALGLGLIEEHPEGAIDNIDALSMDARAEDVFGPMYFSLAAGIGGPLTLGSAQPNNVSGADILVAFPGEKPRTFLNAQQMGLNPQADDLDALAMFDVLQDGVFDSESDIVMFSVRRGSQIIDQIDSALGLPIGPGDILTLPALPNQPPQILLPAELLGLNAGDPNNLIAAVADRERDDLDALSVGAHGDGDMNCNFAWDPDDVPAFALSLHSAELYEATYDLCIDPAVRHGDLNQDGQLGFQDIEDFVLVMEKAGTLDAEQVRALLSKNVPEPRRVGWLAVMFLITLVLRPARLRV